MRRDFALHNFGLVKKSCNLRTVQWFQSVTRIIKIFWQEKSNFKNWKKTCKAIQKSTFVNQNSLQNGFFTLTRIWKTKFFLVFEFSTFFYTKNLTRKFFKKRWLSSLSQSWNHPNIHLKFYFFPRFSSFIVDLDVWYVSFHIV